MLIAVINLVPSHISFPLLHYCIYEFRLISYFESPAIQIAFYTAETRLEEGAKCTREHDHSNSDTLNNSVAHAINKTSVKLFQTISLKNYSSLLPQHLRYCLYIIFYLTILQTVFISSSTSTS